MTDVLTIEQRSYNMSQIKGTDTKPEVKLRKYIYSKGIRGYRKSSDLPGKPDIIFNKYKLAIFVDGCFWHRCPKCFKEPDTNKSFWKEKISGNVNRDKKINRLLSNKGWKILRFWEHELNNNLNKCYLNLYNELKKRGFRDATS